MAWRGKMAWLILVVMVLTLTVYFSLLAMAPALRYNHCGHSAKSASAKR